MDLMLTWALYWQ